MIRIKTAEYKLKLFKTEDSLFFFFLNLNDLSVFSNLTKYLRQNSKYHINTQSFESLFQYYTQFVDLIYSNNWIPLGLDLEIL